MSIVPFVLPLPMPPARHSAQIRTSFGRAAYEGLFPRDRWTDAQHLIARYDVAPDDRVRNTLLAEMQTIIAGTFFTNSPPNEVRHAA